MLKKYLKLSILFAVAVISYQLSAKVIDITLVDLVKQSDLIAYGYSTVSTQPTQNSETEVSFKPITVLKGSAKAKDRTINLCKMPVSSESYDLATLKGNYIVFGSIAGRCYSPVHWISSIVRVDHDVATTSEISDQPDEQPLADFLKKIELAVKRHSIDRKQVAPATGTTPQ